MNASRGSMTLDAVTTPYEQHRGYILAVLARRCGWLAADEREAIFHDAYAVLLGKEQDGQLHVGEMRAQQVRAYLMQTAINKALDEGKRAERNRTEPIGDRALAEPDFTTTPEETTADRLEGAVLREIVSELPKRRQVIIKLRFFFERTPDEIQRILDISSRVYRRELERGVRHIGERFELVRDGRFCDTRRSVIVSYVAGTASDEDARKAREHMANCPGCTRWAAEMREAASEVAAVLPLPALALEESSGPRLADLPGAVHDAASQLLAGAKNQALSIIARLDPGAAGYGATMRPGTVAAVVTSCIAAAGGGATYCATQLGDPIGSLFSDKSPPVSPREPKQAEPKQAEPRPEPPPPDQISAPVSQAGQFQPQDPPAPAANQQKQQPAQATPQTSEDTAVTEFGIEGTGETVAPPTSTAPSSSSTPDTSGSDSSSSAPPDEFELERSSG